MSKLRTRLNRLLSIPLARALDRVSALEQLASAHVDTRRNEYFSFMDERDFTVLQFVDELWPDGRMRHVDVLFGDVNVMQNLTH